VEYLLVGGYAVALHGYVRYTGDMDIWVLTTPENAARVVKVLKDFGAPEADRFFEVLLVWCSNKLPAVIFGVPLEFVILILYPIYDLCCCDALR
jgi:hypothetical protein